MSSKRTLVSYLETASLVLGVSILCFLWGTAVGKYRYFPYMFLNRGFDALRAYTKTYFGSSHPYERWNQSRWDDHGVVRHDADSTDSGWTLTSMGHRPEARLLDMDGEVVHEWHLPFFEAWPNPEHLSTTSSIRYTYWRHTHLLPDGSLVALYAAPGRTPHSVGMIKVDADSNLLWTFSEHAHHDLDVTEEGSIWVLTYKLRDLAQNPLSAVNWSSGTILTDELVQLSSDGREIERIPLMDILVDSRFKRLVERKKGSWDVLHTNNIEVVGEDFAKHHDFVDPDHLMLSIREMDLIGILDWRDEKFVWAERGSWIAQHDPDPLPNGRILMFDNRGARRELETGTSRILELSIYPDGHRVEWSYSGHPDNPFETSSRGSQQPLSNDNVLITESNRGRLLEVTRAGEVVWEYRSTPVRTHEGDRYNPIGNWAARFRPSDLDAEFRARVEDGDEAP